MSNSKKKVISIILPAYNEEAGLKKTLSSLPLKDLKKKGFLVEVLVVDNNSSDGSAEVGLQHGARVILEKSQGYGFAYKAGFSSSKGDYIICMDSDGTYPGESITEIVDLLHDGNDLVITNRFGANGYVPMPLVNKFGNYLLSFFIQRMFPVQLSDSQSGMWGITKNLLDDLKLESNTMSLSQEIKINALLMKDIKYKELPILYFDRVGVSKLVPFKDGMSNFKWILTKYIKRYV